MITQGVAKQLEHAVLGDTLGLAHSIHGEMRETGAAKAGEM